MNRSVILLIDAIINLILGMLLLIFPAPLAEALGVPQTDTRFYPSILGAVLFGIGIALLIEWRRKPSKLMGLGLGGAIAINICGGVVLAGWLLIGGLNIPLRGNIFLWTLVAILVGISSIELVVVSRGQNTK
jgi:hypothetical protein